MQLHTCILTYIQRLRTHMQEAPCRLADCAGLVLRQIWSGNLPAVIMENLDLDINSESKALSRLHTPNPFRIGNLGALQSGSSKAKLVGFDLQGIPAKLSTVATDDVLSFFQSTGDKG